MTLAELLQLAAQRTEAALGARLPAPNNSPERLHQAMRYATLDGGKRVRPALVYATGHLFGVSLATLDVPACAVELIHAYSLVHDDLPAMDDDDLRRGRPTCHRAFDEATAILAGDALQTFAFELLAADPALTIPVSARLKMVATLARASGVAGMCGGQALDIDATGHSLDLAGLSRMHRYKTGALIRASVRLGALAAPTVTEPQLERLDQFADAIGLAFQIRDDILDVEGDTAEMGKNQGSDEQRNKSTYTRLLGLEGAKAKAREHLDHAHALLTEFGPAAAPLAALADFIVNRKK